MILADQDTSYQAGQLPGLLIAIVNGFESRQLKVKLILHKLSENLFIVMVS
jgi:hypothetical protein